MTGKNRKKMIGRGVRVGDSKLYQEDKIWSRYSNDKVDIGEQLAKVIRTLSKAFPLTKALRALSIGSSDEPQFRILETAFRGGLYLFDLEKEALNLVDERVRRQDTGHVYTILDDYKKELLEPSKASAFLKYKLEGEKVNLITLHHSLYYCEKGKWHAVLRNLYQKILDRKGAMHMVLMSASCRDRNTTTWLYNHFAGKCCGHRNDQDLLGFKKEITKDPVFRGAQVLSRTNFVRFFVDDFEKFMAVAWMILLYPNVHKYSLEQREEITEYIYENFWIKKKPLVQAQDHLVVYKGLDFKGLI
jgi:hypothetical protein